MILRENVQRRIVVSAQRGRARPGQRRRGHSSRRSRAAVPMPAGYRVEYGGQFESEQSASQRLLLLGSLARCRPVHAAGAGVRPRARRLLIMLNLPLALIGGVAGVFLAGGVLSVASMIGFITLFGIATRNGIMLVSHIQHLIEQEGVTDFREAVERGRARTPDPDPDDGHGGRTGIDSAGARRRQVGQRDSDADGDRDSVRLDDVDAPEHGRGTDDVFAIWPAHGAGH